jgi:hypothetical protein
MASIAKIYNLVGWNFVEKKCIHFCDMISMDNCNLELKLELFGTLISFVNFREPRRTYRIPSQGISLLVETLEPLSLEQGGTPSDSPLDMVPEGGGTDNKGS